MFFKVKKYSRMTSSHEISSDSYSYFVKDITAVSGTIALSRENNIWMED